MSLATETIANEGNRVFLSAPGQDLIPDALGCGYLSTIRGPKGVLVSPDKAESQPDSLIWYKLSFVDDRTSFAEVDPVSGTI